MGVYTSEKITGKPLYCFKYNEETGEIVKIEIPEYTLETHYWTGKKTYCFDKPKINKSYNHESIAESKIDRYVSGKVYTFNDDIQMVKSIIFAELESRQLKAYAEYRKYAFQFERFLETNTEFDS